MTLENQVVSLDLAKRLKELGVKQESLFYWTEYNDGAEIDFRFEQKLIPPASCSAFTVAELLEILGDDFYMITRYSANKDFGVCSQPDDTIQHKTHNKNLASALAELIIKLHENGNKH